MIEKVIENIIKNRIAWWSNQRDTKWYDVFLWQGDILFVFLVALIKGGCKNGKEKSCL